MWAVNLYSNIDFYISFYQCDGPETCPDLMHIVRHQQMVVALVRGGPVCWAYIW